MWMRRIEGFVLNREVIKEEFARRRDCFFGKVKEKDHRFRGWASLSSKVYLSISSRQPPVVAFKRLLF